MEEPKALLPNGHSDSHTEDKSEQMEVDEVESKMKDDLKTDPKRTKATDSDEATNSSPKNKTTESDKATNQSFENALMQIEKSSIKKKVPQKIVKRSPRISRNKEPPEKDGEAGSSRTEVEDKSDDKSSKKETVEEEKGKEEAKKEVEESEEVTNKEKKESAVIKEVEGKEAVADMDADSGSDPDADFLGFDEPKKSNHNSARDKLQKMIDQLMASTSGSSRSRRSTTVKRSDSTKEVESEQSKAGTSETKAEPETEEHLSDWFDRKMKESQPSECSYYEGCDDDYDYQEGSGVSNAMLIPEVVYRSCGGGPQSSVEDENRSRRSRPSLAAQSERKGSPITKRNYDVSLPQYLKPFEYGWKRELSYRNNTEASSKRMADIFYYTPLGKKIRSIGAVKDYLLGTDLTLENFTFVTKSMNLNDPNKETIRDPRKKPIVKPPTPQLPPLTTRKSSALSKAANSADSPAAAAAVSAEDSSTSKAASPLSTPKISLKSYRPPPKNKANKTPVPEKKSKKSSDDSDNDKDELEMGMLPPLWNESIRPDWSANGSTTMNTKSGGGAEGGGQEEEEEGEEEKVEVCSIKCPRMRGQIPTLACVVCLCLYHPDCVSVRRSVLNYVCKNCQDTNKASSSKPSPSTIHTSPPPLVPISSSSTPPEASQSESSSTPQLQRLLDGKSQPKIVGGVTTWLPPSSMIHLSTTTSKLSTTSQPLATVDSTSSAGGQNAQTLWQMNGKRFLYVPKHNVLSVSPASASSASSDTVITSQSGNLVSPGCVSMPSLIQNSVQSSFFKPAPSTMSHALIVSDTAKPSPTTMSHALIVSDTAKPSPTTMSHALIVSDTAKPSPTTMSHALIVSDTAKPSPTTMSHALIVSDTAKPSPTTMSHALIVSDTAKPSPTTMSHALIVSDTANPNSNSGVLLLPCITTPSGGMTSSENSTQHILLVNGGGGALPAGNFLIGNLPQQQPIAAQQPQAAAQPTANDESEKSDAGSNKRKLEPEKPETEVAAGASPPPAKRSKNETAPEVATAAAPEVTSPEAVTPVVAAPVDPAPVDSAPVDPAPVNPTPDVKEAPVKASIPAAASSSVSVNKDFFMTNVSAIYHALLNSFQYLKVQELLRAARVCHMWRDVAMNRSLWHVVRLKNSRVRDWDGLTATLRQTGTRHLDLRKMLMPGGPDEISDMWTRYAAAVDRLNSLWRVDLCRCPAAAVERTARANQRLQCVAALAIKSSSLDASAFENCRNMTELRLKSSEKNGLDLENLSTLKHLTKMKHLSLTTVKTFKGDQLTEALENMKDLETLELGECCELSASVATKALPKLKRLQRLRLEKGQGLACPTLAVLETCKELKSLVQLELINFDIKSGFDTTIAKCTNLRTLLIIPTYVTQSATTNHLVMEGVSKLSKTLTLFVWGITLELLRVTDLFIDQWEGQKGASGGAKSSNSKKGSGDSIPILKPLSETSNKDAAAPSQVDILQLPKLHKLLTSLLPTTKVKILKVPFSATWRQTVSGPAHIH